MSQPFDSFRPVTLIDENGTEIPCLSLMELKGMHGHILVYCEAADLEAGDEPDFLTTYYDEADDVHVIRDLDPEDGQLVENAFRVMNRAQEKLEAIGFVPQDGQELTEEMSQRMQKILEEAFAEEMDSLLADSSDDSPWFLDEDGEDTFEEQSTLFCLDVSGTQGEPRTEDNSRICVMILGGREDDEPRLTYSYYRADGPDEMPIQPLSSADRQKMMILSPMLLEAQTLANRINDDWDEGILDDFADDYEEQAVALADAMEKAWPGLTVTFSLPAWQLEDSGDE